MIEFYEKFQPFFGNNTETVSDPGITRGGLVSFSKHLNKPLTKDLWEDLTERLKVQRMRIYGRNDFMWTTGFAGDRGVFIHLDDAGNVSEIKAELGSFRKYHESKEVKQAKPENEASLLDEALEKIREDILGRFSPPGTSEVDAIMKHVKFQMANYALAAAVDGRVRKEVESICEEMAFTGW